MRALTAASLAAIVALCVAPPAAHAGWHRYYGHPYYGGYHSAWGALGAVALGLGVASSILALTYPPAPPPPVYVPQPVYVPPPRVIYVPRQVYAPPPAYYAPAPYRYGWGW